MDFATVELGPKMQACSERERRFVWHYVNDTDGNGADAARLAGYSDASDGAKVRAHYLLHRPSVLEAIDEVSRQVMRHLVPLAIRRAKDVLSDPKAFGHNRMIETILNRTGFGEKTEHNVKVEHTVDFRELEALALRLAHESGIDPMKLLGSDAKVIEHDANERASELPADK